MAEASVQHRHPPHGMVGRERELQLLLEQLERAQDGHGRLVLIGGEAGIGKTTLVRELSFEATQRGKLTLIGHCYDLALTPPYGPWIDLHAVSRPGQHDVTRELRFLDADIVANVENQAALFHKARNTLLSHAGQRPMMIALEDLHWADTASLELLRFVARALETHPVLMVVTYRTDELTRQHPLFNFLPGLARETDATRMDLRPLDATAVRAHISARFQLSEEDTGRLATYLEENAEGNPLYVVELLRALVEEDVLSHRSGGWELAALHQVIVPPLLHQVIDGRLAHLEAEPRDLLAIAAVIGQNVPLDLWSTVSGATPAALERTIDRARASHVLLESPDGTGFRFSHALVRQALYNALLLTRRRVWHQRVAETLAASPRATAAEVAHHFQQAGDPRSAAWNMQAAEQAQAIYAPGSAIDYFTRALETAGHLEPDQRIRAYRGRGRAYDTAGDYRSARVDHEKALDLARQEGNDRAEWQALLDLGAVWASRDYEQSGACMRQALDLARGMDDPSILAQSLNWVGNWHVNVEQPFEAQRYHEEALAIFQGLGDRRGVAETHDFLGMATMLAGDLIQGAEHYRRSIALLEEMDDRQRLSSSLINLRGADGQFSIMVVPPGLTIPESHRVSERAVEIAREIGWRSGEAFCLSFLGLNLSAQGRYGAALDAARAGHTIAEEIAHHQWTAMALCTLGTVYFDIAAYTEARACLERSLSLARHIGSRFISRCASGYLALAHVGAGTLDVAEVLLEAELDRAGDPPTVAQLIQWSARVELSLAQGKPDDALQIIDTVMRAMPSGPVHYVAINLHLLRGRALTGLRRCSEAEQELRTAHDGAVSQGARSWLVRVHLALTRLWHAQARWSDVERELSTAGSVAAELADSITDHHLRAQYLRQVSSLVDQLAMSPSSWLSPREVEVLQLVSQGMTDAEVAVRLFISPRTVSQHLRSIYSKLGVSGRAAATRYAIEQGIA
jgi:DNA-binding CsgD family transcriptional regulator